MAKQTGPIKVQGTIENLTFYIMEGEYYVRTKSSLTTKKFFTHKAFERSRKSCQRFAQGNKLASKLYHLITQATQRLHPLLLP